MLKLFEVTVTEEKRTVTISNIGVRDLFRDIEKVIPTSTIKKYMFKNITGRYIILYSFFVPDLYYTLSLIIEYKRRVTPLTVIEKILKELRTKTFYRENFVQHPSKLDYSQLDNLLFKPLPVQLGAFEAYDQKTQSLNLKGYLLAAATGTGKSFLSIALVAMLHADKTIIICPKYTIENVWVEHIVKLWYNKKTYYRSDTDMVLDNTYDFYIFHYEFLFKAIEFANIYKNKFINPCIILDESHNLNDIKSLRTSTYLDFINLIKSNNIIHMSGTPLKALAKEAIPLFRAIDPLFTPKVEEAFTKIYNKSASAALTILNNRLGLVSHKIAKEDVMNGVLPPIVENLVVTLPDASRYTLPTLRVELEKFIKTQMEDYNANMESYVNFYNTCLTSYENTINDNKDKQAFLLYKDYIKEIRKGFDPITMSHMSIYCNNFEKQKINSVLSKEDKIQFNDVKSIIKYPHLKILGLFLGRVVGKRRIELYSELIQHANLEEIISNAEKKTIIFTNYVDTALYCKNYLEKNNFYPLIVYSDTNKDLSAILNTFKNDLKINPLIATINSLSTGVTIVEANTMIFLNQPWRKHEIEQATARMYRIGQTTQTYVYNIVLDTGDIPNLSTRQMEVQLWSAYQIQAMMGDNDLDIVGLEDINDNKLLYEYSKAISFLNW